MKVLVIGNGGREHTIAWRLAQSNLIEDVICVPGNGGTAVESKCRNIDPKDSPALANLSRNEVAVSVAKSEKVDFAVIGPEDPLAEGIADALWDAGIPTVGPKSKGAALEASKDLSKVFMQKYGVACADSQTFTDKDSALAYIRKKGAPIVVKADGLAAGKGVVVAKTLEEAENAVEDLMAGLGEAASKLVIEEYLQGVEISVLAAVSVTEESAANGKACIKSFLPARDHKRLLDGAKGPNTGGMGAVCPLEDVTPETMAAFEKNILQPTLKGLIAEKMDYRGFIFFGLMITKDGPKALEYNVRLGDPETQAVLPMMDFDFAELCQAIMNGTLDSFEMKWKSGFQVAPVAVSGGYPLKYAKGKEITFAKPLIEKAGAKVFIAGAVKDRRENSPTLLTSGGRVLACSAHGDTFEEAWKKSYEAMSGVKFEGMFFRKDIGLPGAAESN
ncbi:phosphoribosylamine--glycine ligase [Treponema ruminis]|uniref:Phosphoribosylamine--glycine ligase n=1 Tax=Treponema ruminis TaxID=744515 RepID=A0A7W8G727_9SPIR|nr:phosphoribosylamine--glycine ligase [Treponema ruminis]MBB5225024.1 phosphoribosylamine--glycine ligase [Treponema ruminis]